MKKNFLSLGLIAAAAFTLTNCTQELDNPVEPSVDGVPFEIIASPVETKTTNEGLNTVWATGDAINVFHAEANAETYVPDGEFKVDSENTFKGTLNGEMKVGSSYDWYAIYPYSSYIETPGEQSEGYVYIGSRSDTPQSQSENNSMAHIAGSKYPLVGVAKDQEYFTEDPVVIAMSHASSLLEVVVTNNTEEDLLVENISFTAPENIVGTFYVNFAGKSLKFTDADFVSKTANLKVTGAEALAKGASAKYYLAIKPFTADAGERLVLSVNRYSKEIDLNAAKTFTAGKIKTLKFAYDKAPLPEGFAVATLTFDSDKANRIDLSSDKQVWTKNGIVFTNEKGSSTNNVADYVAPVRLYKFSSVTITAPGNITKIEFDSAPNGSGNSTYLDFLVKAISGSTATGNIVSVNLDGTSNTVNYTMSAGQVRLYSITVTYNGEGSVAVPEIVVAEKNKTISADGGGLTFAYTLNNLEGKTLSYTSDSEWLSASVSEGNVNVTVTKNEGAAREGKITLTCGDAQSVVLTVSQDASSEAGIQKLTVAQFLAAAVGSTEYELTGVIEGTFNTQFGNFYLNDGTSSVLVYGLTATKQSSNDKSFASLGLRDGDTLTLIGKRDNYNGTDQVGGPAYYVSHIPAPFLDFVSENVIVTYDVTTYSLEITSNTNWTATATEGLTLDKTSGNGNATVVMNFAANETSNDVTHTVTFTFGESTKVFTIKQATKDTNDGPTDVTVEFSKLGYTDAESVDNKPIAADANISMVFKQGAAITAPAYYDSGTAIRMYQNGATLDVTAANGKKITKIVFTFSSNHYYIEANTGSLSEDAPTRTWTGSATSVKFTSTGTDKYHRAYVAKMVITYE